MTPRLTSDLHRHVHTQINKSKTFSVECTRKTQGKLPKMLNLSTPLPAWQMWLSGQLSISCLSSCPEPCLQPQLVPSMTEPLHPPNSLSLNSSGVLGFIKMSVVLRSSEGAAVFPAQPSAGQSRHSQGHQPLPCFPLFKPPPLSFC